MKCLIQRVTQAAVRVDGEVLGEIGIGLLVLAGVEKGDEPANIDRMVERLLGYRVFPDADGKMNLNVCDAAGGLLVVPQFTLAADTRKGTRPSFSSAAAPAVAQSLFELLLSRLKDRHPIVETGRFGADMQVGLINDGPVTFMIES